MSELADTLESLAIFLMLLGIFLFVLWIPFGGGGLWHKIEHLLGWNACTTHSFWVGEKGKTLVMGYRCVKCGRLYRSYTVIYKEKDGGRPTYGPR